MELSIKLVIIVIIIFLYFVTMKGCIDKFVPHNKFHSSTNKSSALKDRHKIDSIDIDLNKDDKNSAYYYEFSNEKYLEILIDMFKPHSNEKYILLRNKEWEFYIDDKITGIYNKAYQYISNKISENTPDVQIVHDLLNKYKIDIENNQYILDIDMILYRNYKMNGKHVNFLVYVDNVKEIMLNIEIKGVVGEDKIGLHPTEAYNITMDNNKHQEYEETKVMEDL